MTEQDIQILDANGQFITGRGIHPETLETGKYARMPGFFHPALREVLPAFFDLRWFLPEQKISQIHSWAQHVAREKPLLMPNEAHRSVEDQQANDLRLRRIEASEILTIWHEMGRVYKDLSRYAQLAYPEFDVRPVSRENSPFGITYLEPGQRTDRHVDGRPLTGFINFNPFKSRTYIESRVNRGEDDIIIQLGQYIGVLFLVKQNFHNGQESPNVRIGMDVNFQIEGIWSDHSVNETSQNGAYKLAPEGEPQ